MQNIFLNHPWILVVILLWSLPWKAAALWRSARRGHIGWFLILLVLNTLGIIDILYIFLFSGSPIQVKDKNKDSEQQTVRQPERRIPRSLQMEDEDEISRRVTVI